jgi:phosphatidylethanolamine/phosphatidyl-N-methylethanolamine N-methyltransferase
VLTKDAPRLRDMPAGDVIKAYRRWAPVYDATFGRLVRDGVKQATTRVNSFSGRLLEAGVGTGLALPHYGPQLSVTGIDFSADMLRRAHARVSKAGNENIESLVEMDACNMTFADSTFDVSVAMYVLTVVPEPQKAMSELARVTKPGGTVLVVNHFSVDHGMRGAIEKGLAKHATKLGWRPEFPVDTVLTCDKLRLVSIKSVKPLGFFTMLEFRRIG